MDHLKHLYADPDLAPLWAELHHRLSTGHPPDKIATVRVHGLGLGGIATLQTLLDTTHYRRNTASAVTIRNETATIPIRSLLHVLKIEPTDLLTVVEQATGWPVVDRTLATNEALARRRQLRSHAHQQFGQLPGLVSRFGSAPATDHQANRTLIDALAWILRQLPITPALPLAKLAHDVTPDHDPHYFDLHTRRGAYLVAAVAELTGQTEPTRPDRIRALLKSTGILADQLTSTVLLHNVRVVGDGPIDRRLRESANPVALTLLDLTETPPQFARQTLTVVENPSILEIARTRRTEPPENLRTVAPK